MFENDQLLWILLLTRLINRLASIATQIWISMALTLSPRKYLSGKFCFICLKKLCKAFHNLFYGKEKIMQSILMKASWVADKIV